MSFDTRRERILQQSKQRQMLTSDRVPLSTEGSDGDIRIVKTTEGTRLLVKSGSEWLGTPPLITLTNKANTNEIEHSFVTKLKDKNNDEALTLDASMTIHKPLILNSTLNATGAITGTLATAAQSNITSLGTLTTLTVDDITINGSTISDSGDFTLDIGGNIELNADGNNFTFKDGSVTRMIAGSNLNIYAVIDEERVISFNPPHGTTVDADNVRWALSRRADNQDFYIYDADGNNNWNAMQCDSSAQAVLVDGLSASDEKLKEDKVVISNPISKIKQISGYKFKWKSDCPNEYIAHKKRGTYDYGVIAQEIEAVLPEIVKTLDAEGAYGGNAQKKVVSYDRLIPLLIEAIKELELRVASLE